MTSRSPPVSVSKQFISFSLTVVKDTLVCLSHVILPPPNTPVCDDSVYRWAPVSRGTAYPRRHRFGGRDSTSAGHVRYVVMVRYEKSRIDEGIYAIFSCLARQQSLFIICKDNARIYLKGEYRLHPAELIFHRPRIYRYPDR